MPTHIYHLYDGFWLDPTDSEFGPNAKFLKADVNEAKKLLSAAGHANGFPTTLFFSADHANAYPYSTYTQILPGMLGAGGINAEQKPLTTTLTSCPTSTRHT
jgi:hypothetical protein